MVVASCIQAARVVVPLLPKCCRSRDGRRALPVGAYLRDRARIAAVLRTRAGELGQRATDDAFGHAGLVEVLRDSPEPERESGAEDEAGVDVGRLRDDALLEDMA